MRAAVIQDISGLGRCSLAAALPVLAALGVQACPVPTAALTSQTGFRRFEQLDCAPLMEQFPLVWKDLNIKLDGVCTGFMGTPRQLNAAQSLIDTFRPPLLMIDPVLGDDGALYPCFDEAFLAAMRRFAAQADILTPNVTEACLLTNTNYAQFAAMDEAAQHNALEQICTVLPASITAITGWRCGDNVCTVLSNHGKTTVYKSPAVEGSYSGTGDLFAACLFGYLLRGVSPEKAMPNIMSFLEACLRSAAADARTSNVPAEEGVPFERHLNLLINS